MTEREKKKSGENSLISPLPHSSTPSSSSTPWARTPFFHMRASFATANTVTKLFFFSPDTRTRNKFFRFATPIRSCFLTHHLQELTLACQLLPLLPLPPSSLTSPPHTPQPAKSFCPLHNIVRKPKTHTHTQLTHTQRSSCARKSSAYHNFCRKFPHLPPFFFRNTLELTHHKGSGTAAMGHR